MMHFGLKRKQTGNIPMGLSGNYNDHSRTAIIAKRKLNMDYNHIIKKFIEN
jgi:hypothetical protein